MNTLSNFEIKQRKYIPAEVNDDVLGGFDFEVTPLKDRKVS